MIDLHIPGSDGETPSALGPSVEGVLPIFGDDCASMSDMISPVEELRIAKEEAEKARRKAEELAQFPLYDPSPLIRFDMYNKKLLFVNPAAFNRYSDIFRKGAEHPLLAGINIPASKAFRERRTVTREVTIGNVTYQQAITPNLLSQDQIITVYSHDITQLKETQAVLRQETERAEAASRSKSDFLANMSHELRTPMNGILGMATLLRDTPITEEQRELVETIAQSGESLLLLLNDILDLSKIEASELTFEEMPFNIHTLMRDTIRLFEPLAKKKGLALEFSYSHVAPDCVVGDPARMRQVVTNLVGNALKFTDSGHVRLDITSRRVEVGRTMLLFRIDDTGIGIKEQNLQRIFNKFTQADESTTRRYGGTGLGLTICKLLVEALGGRIGVESAFSKGASFWFEVPLALATEEQTERLSEHHKKEVAMSEETQVRFGDCRIIVVDDHPVNLFFAKKLLAKFGFRGVDTADDGKTALAMIEKNSYDTIILDCQMPDMDGYEVSRIIREKEYNSGRHVPIIAMTANAMVGDKEKCIQAGMDDYVTKPINADRMMEVLVKWVPELEITVTEKDDADLPEVANDRVVQTSRVQVPETPSGDPVDMNHLREFIGDDKEEQSFVIGLFLKAAEDSITVMEGQVALADNEAWKRAAHKLKGSAANFGAEYLKECCWQAEQLSDATPIDKAQLLHLVRQAYENVHNYLNNLAAA